MKKSRYDTDACYRKVVDRLEELMHECRLTPVEIREAAILASIHYEQKQHKKQFETGWYGG
jgi:hypothetical protein